MIFFICAVLLIYIGCGLYASLEVTYYTIKSEKIPDRFDGYKIVQISDLHATRFGKRQERLVEAVLSGNPDLIVLTGDIVSRRTRTFTSVEDFLYGIAGKAPIYAIAGNHELASPNAFGPLRKLYKKYGVVLLIEGESQLIRRDDAQICLYGAGCCGSRKNGYRFIKNQKPLDNNSYNILLYHFANHFGTVSRAGFDLVLSGHMHGGIVRLPLIGGVFGNDFEFFPKYDAGLFIENGSTLISNRGLGQSYVPRFYNRSECVHITLKTGKPE